MALDTRNQATETVSKCRWKCVTWGKLLMRTEKQLYRKVLEKKINNKQDTLCKVIRAQPYLKKQKSKQHLVFTNTFTSTFSKQKTMQPFPHPYDSLRKLLLIPSLSAKLHNPGSLLNFESDLPRWYLRLHTFQNKHHIKVSKNTCLPFHFKNNTHGLLNQGSCSRHRSAAHKRHQETVFCFT